MPDNLELVSLQRRTPNPEPLDLSPVPEPEVVAVSPELLVAVLELLAEPLDDTPA